MKDKKKKSSFSLKEIFSDRYTPFQRMWIIILMIAICASLILTIWQIASLTLRKSNPSSNKEKKVAVSASPSIATDSVILAKTKDAGKEYVKNTLFLGDSNTVRFMNIKDDDGETYTTKDNTIGVVGMGVDAIDSLECMEFSTGTYTMVDSVKILQPQRIIITFGTNNLTGSDSKSDRDTFIESYTKQLKKIHEAYPQADLIVNSIPPISKDTVYTKLDAKEIMHWNTSIEEMCRKNKWHYLNSFEALADMKTGYAREGMMDPVDGLHLGDQGLKTLFNYIRTHASTTEDKREKPLKEIPEIVGCKTDMITTNPLTGSDFTGTEGGYNNATNRSGDSNNYTGEQNNQGGSEQNNNYVPPSNGNASNGNANTGSSSGNTGGQAEPATPVAPSDPNQNGGNTTDNSGNSGGESESGTTDESSAS